MTEVLQQQMPKPALLHQVVEQPIAYPTLNLEQVWDWLGDANVAFQTADPELQTGRNGFFGVNHYGAFEAFFDVIYTTEGLVFLRAADNSDGRVKLHDPMEVIASNVMEQDQPGAPRMIAIYGAYYYESESGHMTLTDTPECLTTITEGAFEARVKGHTEGVRAWADGLLSLPSDLCRRERGLESHELSEEPSLL